MRIHNIDVSWFKVHKVIKALFVYTTIEFQIYIGLG